MSESLKITEAVLNKLEVFQRKYLRSILRIVWPNVINNADLYVRTSYTPLTEVNCRRRWEMDRSCSEDAEYNDCKSVPLMNAKWKEKARKAKKRQDEEQWQER